MLEDGVIADRARLPRQAVADQPIAMSADSLLQSVASAHDAQGHAITLSG